MSPQTMVISAWLCQRNSSPALELVLTRLGQRTGDDAGLRIQRQPVRQFFNGEIHRTRARDGERKNEGRAGMDSDDAAPWNCGAAPGFVAAMICSSRAVRLVFGAMVWAHMQPAVKSQHPDAASRNIFIVFIKSKGCGP